MKVAFAEPALPKSGALAALCLEDRQLSSTAHAIDEATGGMVVRAMAGSRFQGKANEILSVTLPAGHGADRLILVGLGKAASEPEGNLAAVQTGSQVVTESEPTMRPAGSSPVDDNSIAALRDKWRASVLPHRQALQDAAQTHYQVIQNLRTQQQDLIDQADKLQRLIDQLEKEYSEMTTPKPE
jgi:conjugal transfer/entry exclusion protein